MKSIPIFFFKEEIKFKLLEQDKIRKWILKLIKAEGFDLQNLNLVFCTDVYLRKINKKYLDHNFFTDIVTFDNSVFKKIIDGDIYISIDRVRANSISYNNSFNDELHRVIAHGILHLLGYGDKNPNQKIKMKEMEDFWLKNRRF